MTNPVFKTNHPFGNVAKIAVTADTTMAATISEQVTQLTISEMAGAGTLNLTVGAEVNDGAELHIIASADGTGRALTFGTGITGNNVTVTANKTWLFVAKKFGANFIVSSALATN